MRMYKITYSYNDTIQVAQTEAKDEQQARYMFELCIPSDYIISVEEVG